MKRAAVLILLISFLSTFSLYWNLVKKTIFFSEEYTAEIHESRFAELKRNIPNHELIGYISDAESETDAARNFFLTQYVLAPAKIVQDQNIKPAYIILDCQSLNNKCLSKCPVGYSSIKDFGKGVYLLRQEDL